MKPSSRRAGGLCLLVACAVPVAAAEDIDVIEYRQHVMRSLDEQSAALGMILSGVIPPDNFQSHLESIALAARMSVKAFNAKVPGGEAKPVVWSDWPDFSKRMAAFAEATAKVAKKAEEQGPEAVSADLVDALSCKSCHDVYRAKK